MSIRMLHYTGIGSRSAPSETLELMTRIAARLALRGYVLRSGAASGSDAAFEAGAGEACEIYLPWRGFNGSRSNLFGLATERKAIAIANAAHPFFQTLKDSVQKLHTRNVYQVLGADVNSPATFVVCWTPDGAESAAQTSVATGGTGTAIRIADMFQVPVINMRKPHALDRIAEIVKSTATTSKSEPVVLREPRQPEHRTTRKP